MPLFLPHHHLLPFSIHLFIVRKREEGWQSGTSTDRGDFTTIRHLYSQLSREPTMRHIIYSDPRSKGITPVFMWHRPDKSFTLPVPCLLSSLSKKLPSFPLPMSMWDMLYSVILLNSSIKNYSSTISFTCSSLGKINTGLGRHFHPGLHKEGDRNHSWMQVWGIDTSAFVKAQEPIPAKLMRVKITDLWNYQNPHKRNFIIQVGMHSQDGTFQILSMSTNYKQKTRNNSVNKTE